jgi:hypothetical protein
MIPPQVQVRSGCRPGGRKRPTGSKTPNGVENAQRGRKRPTGSKTPNGVENAQRGRESFSIVRLAIWLGVWPRTTPDPSAPAILVGTRLLFRNAGRAVDDGRRLWPNGTGLGDDRCRTNWEGWFDEFTGCADANEWLDNSVLLGCSDGQCVGARRGARRGPRAHRVLDCPGNRARRGCGVGWSAGLGWVSCRADRCSRRLRTSIC